MARCVYLGCIAVQNNISFRAAVRIGRRRVMNIKRGWALRKKGNTVIAILGMHRSGTSLAGQMVHALGVPMGDNLIVANEYNERGYFEDSVVVKIHDELLLALGRPWQSINSTMPLPTDWQQRPETAAAKEKLGGHIKSELRQGSWAVKDPRMARFLPLWKGLATELGFELVPLLCVRSPSEVAGSLAKRDHFPLNMGELLWTIYNFEIVDSLGPSLDCVLCYEDWFRRPEENLKRLAAAAGVELTNKRCVKLASTIVDAKLRHHVASEGKVPGPNAEFYRLLHQWANTNTPPAGLATLLTIIRDSGMLFAPWYEACASSYMAEAEVAKIAEQARITSNAEENLKAYQQTEQARIDALVAIKQVEQERDSVAVQAQKYLEAYQQTEQARIDALVAIKQVEQERDSVAVQAQN
jgi:galactitol-specific phosphotransferase system IIB component